MRSTQVLTFHFEDSDSQNPRFHVVTTCCDSSHKLTKNEDGTSRCTTHGVELKYDPDERTLVITGNELLEGIDIYRQADDDYRIVLVRGGLLDILNGAFGTQRGGMPDEPFDRPQLPEKPRRRRTFMGFRI